MSTPVKSKIYHMTERLLSDLISGVKYVIILSLCTHIAMDVITFPENMHTTSGLSFFYCIALFHSQTQRHNIII